MAGNRRYMPMLDDTSCVPLAASWMLRAISWPILSADTDRLSVISFVPAATEDASVTRRLISAIEADNSSTTDAMV